MDNINISFAADKSADSEKRLNDIENFISLLADRIKFCLADINDDVSAKSDGNEEKKLIYQALSDGVGEFTNSDKNCEIFNDYENNKAEAYYSHAEGYKTTASAPYSHTEGRETTAANTQAHAEGYNTSATGQSSHVENEGCVASGSNSHAEGYYTRAYGEHSHASGNHTVAGYEVFALGSYNATSENVWLVVGNGWEEAHRSDALVLDRAGNLHISGMLTADGGVGYQLPAANAGTLGGVIIGDNISVTADGVISVDLSAYLRSDEISDWAKAESKPTYTAQEVGAAEKEHTHTRAQITDFPTALPANGGNADTVDGKHASDFAAAEHTHTAEEVGAAAKSHTHNTATTTADGFFSKTDKAKLDGINAKNYYPAKAACVTGGNYDDYTKTGIYELLGTTAQPTTNAPNGVDKNNNFYVQVFARAAAYLTQVAVSARSDKTVYIRSMTNGVWNSWEKLNITGVEQKITALEARVAALEAAAVSGGEV